MSQPGCHYRRASSPLKITLINSLKDTSMSELPWVLGFHLIWKLFYWVCGIWHYSNGCDHRLKDKVLIHHLALMLHTLGPAIFFSRLFFFCWSMTSYRKAFKSLSIEFHKSPHKEHTPGRNMGKFPAILTPYLPPGSLSGSLLIPPQHI